MEHTHELGALYHNRELHPIPQVAREFLYARFARSIFPLLSSFLSGGPKYLRVFVRTPFGFQQNDELANWQDVLQQRERSNPNRRRGEAADGGQNDDDVTPDSDVDSLDAASIGDSDIEHPVLTTSASPEVPPTAQPVIDSLEALTGYFATSTENDDDMQHDRRMQELAFPEMGVERVHGVGHVWEDITWYPGSERTERLKKLFSQDRGWVEILAGRKRSLECGDDSLTRFNLQRRV